jgi:hypothetical protein
MRQHIKALLPERAVNRFFIFFLKHLQTGKKHGMIMAASALLCSEQNSITGSRLSARG